MCCYCFLHTERSVTLGLPRGLSCTSWRFHIFKHKYGKDVSLRRMLMTKS